MFAWIGCSDYYPARVLCTRQSEPLGHVYWQPKRGTINTRLMWGTQSQFVIKLSIRVFTNKLKSAQLQPSKITPYCTDPTLHYTKKGLNFNSYTRCALQSKTFFHTNKHKLGEMDKWGFQMALSVVCHGDWAILNGYGLFYILWFEGLAYYINRNWILRVINSLHVETSFTWKQTVITRQLNCEMNIHKGYVAQTSTSAKYQ